MSTSDKPYSADSYLPAGLMQLVVTVIDRAEGRI